MPTSSSSAHLPFGENKNAEWYGKDILSVKQFSRADLEYVFGVAQKTVVLRPRLRRWNVTRRSIAAPSRQDIN